MSAAAVPNQAFHLLGFLMKDISPFVTCAKGGCFMCSMYIVIMSPSIPPLSLGVCAGSACILFPEHMLNYVHIYCMYISTDNVI